MTAREMRLKSLLPDSTWHFEGVVVLTWPSPLELTTRSVYRIEKLPLKLLWHIALLGCYLQSRQWSKGRLLFTFSRQSFRGEGWRGFIALLVANTQSGDSDKMHNQNEGFNITRLTRWVSHIPRETSALNRCCRRVIHSRFICLSFACYSKPMLLVCM